MSSEREPPPEGSAPLPERLRRALARPLPGAAAHRRALPRGYEREGLPAGAPIVEAAVLLALWQEQGGGRVSIPLIRRPDSMARHAGQISLPGGVVEGAEDPVACALREAREEIGLPPASVDLLGTLSPIVIPVSRSRVVPVVGWLRDEPVYRADAREVLGIIFADPDRLVEEGPIGTVERWRDGARIEFPAYLVQGRKVWGATALILAEFLEVWRSARGEGDGPTGIRSG